MGAIIGGAVLWADSLEERIAELAEILLPDPDPGIGDGQDHAFALGPQGQRKPSRLRA